MGCWRSQIDLPHWSGRDYKVRRELKKGATRYRRHLPIEEDERGGKNYIRATVGWMY